MSEEWRTARPWERAVVGRLLRDPFVGSETLLSQWRTALVRDSGVEGSFEILPDASIAAAATRYSVPVEAVADDIDGGEISILLHAPGGILAEVEILREDGERVGRRPEASELRIWHPGAP